MVRGKLMADARGSSREKNFTWHEDQSRFMLEWCIDYMKQQHVGFKFRKQHLMLCADALNKKFAMGVTVDLVDRHYRYYKENWGYIAKALRNSGNTFDQTRCVVKISESEKNNISDRERRLFAKPTKFFKEMQELFTDCSVTGYFARDQNTSLGDPDDADSDDTRDIIDLNCYAPIEVEGGEDSDTLPTPTRNGNGSTSSSSNTKKRPRCTKSPTKKPLKTKSRFAECTEGIIATMKSIQDALAAPAAIEISPPSDPHKALWQRLEDIPLTPDQRVLIGEHLSAKENKGKRGWLTNASDSTLHAWVFKYLCEKEGLNV